MGTVVLQTPRTLRYVPLTRPRHIVIHSVISLNLVAIRGTQLIPKNEATVEIAHAWVLLIVVPILKFLHIALTCEVEAPCAVRPYAGTDGLPIILSLCAFEFVLNGRQTLCALLLPLPMRAHWFDENLLLPADVSIPRSVTTDARPRGTPSSSPSPSPSQVLLAHPRSAYPSCLLRHSLPCRS